MKTAVSIPDDLARKAAAAAKRLRISRSELYARAIAQFLDNDVTKRLNEVYSRHPSNIDPVLNHAQLETLEKVTW